MGDYGNRAAFTGNILSALVSILTVFGGIWAVAAWTSTQEAKIDRMDDRIAAVEKVIASTPAREMRLTTVEQRLNWIDEEKKRDRAESQQLNRDIREALDRLNSAVIKLEANALYHRRR